MFCEEFVFHNTRAKILCDRKWLIEVAKAEIVGQNRLLEQYIASHHEFLFSLSPLEPAGNAPGIVAEMCAGARFAGVGPMAAVAGAIAERAARAMKEQGASVAVVENQGDIFAFSDRGLSIGVFSGSGELAFSLEPSDFPIAICSSSSFLGHSLSLGECDLATVAAEKGAIADAFATALCNMVKEEADLGKALGFASGKKLRGALLVKGGKTALCGRLPGLARGKGVEEKITASPYSNLNNFVKKHSVLNLI